MKRRARIVTWFSGLLRPATIGLGLLALVFAGDLARAFLSWPQAQGWEYEQIARAWADGNGYSFRGEGRWLFDPTNPDDRTEPGGYYPTAWEEPVPVLMLGTFFWMFGDYGRLAMPLANALFFAATLVVVYHLGRRLQGSWFGLASAGILALIPTPHRLVQLYLGGSVLGGLLVGICALLLLWFLEHASARRGLLLGAALGLAALTQAATIAFLPVAALLALWSQSPLTWRAWRSAGVIVGAALLVISPWAVRNYVTFDEAVPLRNGAGAAAYLGNRALAETFEEDLVSDRAVKPPWTADSVLEAMHLIGITRNRRDLDAHSEDTVRAMAPTEFADYNEAQRDKALMRAALAFMLQHPLTTLQLAMVKGMRFLYPADSVSVKGIPASFVGLLAVLGAAVSLRDRRKTALGLMALAYAGVYALTYPLYYRYRYPIEPVLALLAGMAVVWLAQLGWQLRARLARAPGSDPGLESAGPSG